MNALHRRLLAGAIDTAVGDAYFVDLARRIAHDTNPEPVVVLSGDAVDGRRIRIYEGVALGPSDSDLLRRGFIWIAVVGEARTYPSRRNPDGTVIPGRIIGAHVAFSTRSAQDALSRARLGLAD